MTTAGSSKARYSGGLTARDSRVEPGDQALVGLVLHADLGGLAPGDRLEGVTPVVVSDRPEWLRRSTVHVGRPVVDSHLLPIHAEYGLALAGGWLDFVGALSGRVIGRRARQVVDAGRVGVGEFTVGTLLFPLTAVAVVDSQGRRVRREAQLASSVDR